MYPETIVRLSRSGRGQTVRIPEEFTLPGTEARIRRVGERLIIEPATRSSLLAFLATLEPIEEELGPIEDLPPEDAHL